jgi:hypothetical protein
MFSACRRFILPALLAVLAFYFQTTPNSLIPRYLNSIIGVTYNLVIFQNKLADVEQVTSIGCQSHYLSDVI